MGAGIHGLDWCKFLVYPPYFFPWRCVASSLEGTKISIPCNIDLFASALAACSVESQIIHPETPSEPRGNPLIYSLGHCPLQCLPRHVHRSNLVRNLHLAVQGYASDYEADWPSVHQQRD